MDKVLVLNELKKHYEFKKEYEFADFLGIKPQSLSSWYKRNTFDIELIYAKCKDINPDWLLTGKGEMLRNSEELQVDCKQKIVKIQEELDFKTEQVNFYQEKSIDLQKKLEDCENEKKRINTIS